MRSLTFWLVTVGCLLVAAQAFQLPNIEEPEEDVLDEVAEDEDVDIARMLGDLFEDEEIDEDEDDDDEEVTGRQLATVTGSDQERFNTFMDTILAQLELQAKRDFEPLKFTPIKQKKNNKNGKKKQKKNKSRKDKNTDKKEDKDEKKSKRNSKNVELSDMEEELHQIQRREAETEEEVTGRKASNDDEEIDNEKRNKNRKKNNKNKNKNNNKKNNKNNKNNKRKSNNKVVLQGLSHIKREGDVKLYNMNKGRILRTEFAVGPVELDITRKIKDEEHKAAATANKLNGVLLIKVNKNGKPRVKKLVLKRPTDITTTGSIARGDFGARKGIFKKSIKEVSPIAAKKLFRAAKQIIQNVK